MVILLLLSFTLVLGTFAAPVPPSGYPRCRPRSPTPPSLKLIILGAPGAGKSFISSQINREYNTTIISSGNILRQEAKKNTSQAKMIAELIAAGTLVPDEIVIQLVNESIAKVGSNFILDGYPRTLREAEYLFETQTPIDSVIQLMVPNETIIQRLANRWVHLPSGRTYNLLYRPPKVPGKDDLTGEPLQRRVDDDPAVVKVRLESYERELLPIMTYLRERAPVKVISGGSENWTAVKQHVDSILKSKEQPRFMTLFDRLPTCIK